MKSSLLILSIAVTLLCAFLLAQKNRELEQARARAARVERQRQASANELEEQKRRLHHLQEAWQQTESEALQKSSASAQPLTSANVTASNDTGSLSAIFRDAAMQELLKDEARLGAARNVKAMFDSGLARRLNLNDEQSAALHELLLRKASLFWERMLLPMMTGELDEAGMAAAGKLLKQSFDENTAQLRALLGNDGYEVYQWYEKTQPERDHARQFIPEFAQAGQALSEDQRTALVGIMTEERANFRFRFDPGDPSQLDFEHWYANFSNDKIEAFGAELQQLNQQIVERAREVMSAEQVNLLQGLLNRQLQKGRLTMLTTTAALAKPR